MSLASGLTAVPTDELEALLRALHRGHLTFPLKCSEVMTLGLNGVGGSFDALRGLDERGASAVVVAVLAERRRLDATLAEES